MMIVSVSVCEDGIDIGETVDPRFGQTPGLGSD